MVTLAPTNPLPGSSPSTSASKLDYTCCVVGPFCGENSTTGSPLSRNRLKFTMVDFGTFFMHTHAAYGSQRYHVHSPQGPWGEAVSGISFFFFFLFCFVPKLNAQNGYLIRFYERENGSLCLPDPWGWSGCGCGVSFNKDSFGDKAAYVRRQQWSTETCEYGTLCKGKKV